MIKKAILKVDKDSLNEVARLYNGEEVIIREEDENYSVVRPANADYPIFKVWNGCLKEIKQPMNVRQAFLTAYPENSPENIWRAFRRGWAMAIENEKLKRGSDLRPLGASGGKHEWSYNG